MSYFLLRGSVPWIFVWRVSNSHYALFTYVPHIPRTLYFYETRFDKRNVEQPNGHQPANAWFT